MSAQAGVWNFDGKPVDPGLLRMLSESLKQQGPDGESRFLDVSIAMLYHPFHTTLESRIEKQPYRSSIGLVFTWDGRLDNREELIRQLHNDLTDDQSDVAIVAAAFERWGRNCFRQLIGDWAVSIWKPQERELIFACDYMCIRHIYYYLKKDGVCWSTNLASLVLLSGDRFHIDDSYIAGYFANDADSHLTPYQEIRQVPAGQFVCVGNGKVSVQRHWQFSSTSRVNYKTDAEYEEHFRHVFRESVRKRLRSDAPVLAELSGGLDSSSIVCVADDILAKEGAQTPRVDTLSYYDKTEPNGDDWIYFQKVEEKRARVGTHIDVTKFWGEVSLEYPDFFPQPGYFGSGYRRLDMERAYLVRSGGHRVVFSGVGGDEFMGGVSDPRAYLADLIVKLKFAKLISELKAWSLVKKKPLIQLFLQVSTTLLPTALGQHLIQEGKVQGWMDRGFARRTKLGTRQLGPAETFGMWLPTRRYYMGGVLAMGNKMAHCLPRTLTLEEVRYPYLDQNLVEFVLSIPASQLLRPGERRSLMRRSLAQFVPTEILCRRTKGTSARKVLVVVNTNWQHIERAFSSPVSSFLGFINPPKYLEALQNLRNGKIVGLIPLSRAISLEYWLRDLVRRDLLVLGGRSESRVTPQALHVPT